PPVTATGSARAATRTDRLLATSPASLPVSQGCQQLAAVEHKQAAAGLRLLELEAVHVRQRQPVDAFRGARPERPRQRRAQRVREERLHLAAAEEERQVRPRGGGPGQELDDPVGVDVLERVE